MTGAQLLARLDINPGPDELRVLGDLIQAVVVNEWVSVEEGAECIVEIRAGKWAMVDGWLRLVMEAWGDDMADPYREAD